MLNLFSNCIKYNKPGGAIYTRMRELEHTDDTVTYEFFIRDTGVGMTQDFIDNHLFEAFTQGDNAARSQYGGTGLGMSIVAQLVKKDERHDSSGKHGGRGQQLYRGAAVCHRP